MAEKAKIRLSWKLEGSELHVFVVETAEARSILAKFELRKLFPSFTELTEGQRFAIQYGVKQKLSDSIAPAEIETIQQKKDTLEGTWKDWLSGDLFKPTVRKRGESVPFAATVLALRAEGLKDAVIAKVLGKSLEVVKAVV